MQSGSFAFSGASYQADQYTHRGFNVAIRAVKLLGDGKSAESSGVTMDAFFSLEDGSVYITSDFMNTSFYAQSTGSWQVAIAKQSSSRWETWTEGIGTHSGDDVLRLPAKREDVEWDRYGVMQVRIIYQLKQAGVQYLWTPATR